VGKIETKENPFALAEPHWGRNSIDAVAFEVSVPEFKNVSSWKSNANASPFIRDIVDVGHFQHLTRGLGML
jgi:hypothetical protein